MTATVTPNLDLSSALVGFLKESCPSRLRPNPYAKVKLRASNKAIDLQLETPIPGKSLARTAISPATTHVVYSLLLPKLMGHMTPHVCLGQDFVQRLVKIAALLPHGETIIHPSFICTVTDHELATRCPADAFLRCLKTPRPLPTCAQVDERQIAWACDSIRQLHWPYWLMYEQAERILGTAPTSEADFEEWNAALCEKTLPYVLEAFTGQLT